MKLVMTYYTSRALTLGLSVVVAVAVNKSAIPSLDEGMICDRHNQMPAVLLGARRVSMEVCQLHPVTAVDIDQILPSYLGSKTLHNNNFTLIFLSALCNKNSKYLEKAS